MYGTEDTDGLDDGRWRLVRCVCCGVARSHTLMIDTMRQLRKRRRIIEDVHKMSYGCFKNEIIELTLVSWKQCVTGHHSLSMKMQQT